MKMLALQHHQLVGHDILLARHGSHITTMRVDRNSDRVVAYLDDGSIDSAPNVIYPGLQIPETGRGVFRNEWTFMAVVTACSAGFLGVLIAAAVALAGMAGDPALTELLSNYPSN